MLKTSDKKNKLIIKGPDAQISKDDAKKMEKAIRKAQKNGKFPVTAQATIPYRAMYRNGICQLEGYSFSKTIAFDDINYQLKDNDDKKTAFHKLSDLYNYFTEDTHVQMTYMNTRLSHEELVKRLTVPACGDGYDDLREELSRILLEKEEEGNKGIERNRYLTYVIEEKDAAMATRKMKDIDKNIQQNLKRSGLRSGSKVLEGTERLRVLHSAMHPEGESKFKFNWNLLSKDGLNTKDFIAPMSFRFPVHGRYFRMGDIYGNVSLLSLDCPQVDDRIITDILSIDTPIIISLHIDPIDRVKAKKYIQKRNMQLNSSKIKEQTTASREGYDIDILPPELTANGDDTARMLREINSTNESLFNITILVTCFAKSPKDLQAKWEDIEKRANKQSCQLILLRDQQEQGFVSTLPLGLNKVEIQRTIMTSQLAMLNPFTTVKMAMPGAPYYGVNPLDNMLVFANRMDLKNANGLYLGVPGGGKSLAGKREKLMFFLLTDNCDIMVIDPENEYAALTKMLGGQVIKLDANTKQYINPMDINFDPGYDDEDAITTKSLFMISLAEQIASPKVNDMRVGLEGDEISIIDEVTKGIYQPLKEKYWEGMGRNPYPEEMPTLSDFYEGLRNYQHPKAQRIADCFKIYITGSLNVFNHHTNVDLGNRVVCFNIKRLSGNLREVALLILINFIWDRVTNNRNLKKKTLLDIDEFHLMLRDPQTAEYFVEFWKRFRKWGGVPTGLTQNVTDMLKSSKIEQIFENSDFIYMLPQGKHDKDILADALNISEEELTYVTQTDPGEGLMFYGNKIIPFKDHFPPGRIYNALTTKLEEVEAVNG
nr:conjugal transfer protein TraE [uncultured Butyrivibrio sp.]